MSYFWPDGYLIAVKTDGQGCPYLFNWDWYNGTHEVWLIVDRWSVADLWSEEPEKRTYYFVVTETGLAAIIFLDVPTQTWYMQWAYD